jgi:hypothetical protein
MMHWIWLIGGVLSAGIYMAIFYENTVKNSGTGKFDWSDSEKSIGMIFIGFILGLAWPITVPVYGVFFLTRRIIKKVNE